MSTVPETGRSGSPGLLCQPSRPDLLILRRPLHRTRRPRTPSCPYFLSSSVDPTFQLHWCTAAVLPSTESTPSRPGVHLRTHNHPPYSRNPPLLPPMPSHPSLHDYTPALADWISLTEMTSPHSSAPSPPHPVQLPLLSLHSLAQTRLHTGRIRLPLGTDVQFSSAHHAARPQRSPHQKRGSVCPPSYSSSLPSLSGCVLQFDSVCAAVLRWVRVQCT